MTELITIKPIATIHTDTDPERIPSQRRNMVSQIKMLPEYLDAITGLDEYSHIFVLFWMHQVRRADYQNIVHPRGREDLPLRGCLASRGRNHPNPVGLAVAELLELNGDTLTVKKLDAFDGTPVIDIKPYDDYDRVAEPRVPDWWPGRQKSAGPCT